jgi:hypothetical protein
MENEEDFSLEGLTEEEIARLRKKASEDWSGATVAYLRFRQLVIDYKAKKKN